MRRLRKISKYQNKKVVVGGQVYDSILEYRRGQQLMLLQRAGEISNLRRQVSYELIPTQREKSTRVYQKGPKKGQPVPGKVIEQATDYVADYVYTDNKTGEEVVEDTKGVRTKDYIIKRKLMLYVHGIRVQEI